MSACMLSLFAGYGGLDMALEDVLNVSPVYVADIEPGPRKVLAFRYPDAPNLGDVTKVTWDELTGVRVICGGSPCQDISAAGNQAGMREGTRSNLWVEMREAIRVIRPELVVWENVNAAKSATASSDLESCPGCVGDLDDAEPVLRALGRVLGDLAELGFDAEWVSVPAAGVGCAHLRWRVFVVAWPTNAPSDPAWIGHERGGDAWGRWDGPTNGGIAPVTLLPTPTTRDVKGQNQRGDDTCLTGALLPTPRATDHTKGGPNQRGSSGDLMLPSAVRASTWGDYAKSIARAEAAFGPAPEPTEAETGLHLHVPLPGNPHVACACGNKAKSRRLSCRFDEWLMGLPAGWITDVPGVTHAEALKMCGNGVVPAQAALAIRICLARVRAEVTA